MINARVAQVRTRVDDAADHGEPVRLDEVVLVAAVLRRDDAVLRAVGVLFERGLVGVVHDAAAEAAVQRCFVHDDGILHAFIAFPCIHVLPTAS